MNFRWLTSLALLVAAGCLLTATTSTAADPKDKPVSKEKMTPEDAADKRADDVNDIMTAYQLADFGKKHRSPEALITAAGFFRKAALLQKDRLLKEIEERPEVSDEKDLPKGDAPRGDARAPDFEEEAGKLFDEASTIALELKLNVEPLIKAARAREYKSEATRAVIGGPRTITRHIRGGQTHVFKFNFEPQMPCAIGFRATMPLKATVVRGDNDNVWAAAISTGGMHRGVPGASRSGKVPVTIRFTNIGSQPVQYTLFVN
jgi:hypothetical protein